MIFFSTITKGSLSEDKELETKELLEKYQKLTGELLSNIETIDRTQADWERLCQIKAQLNELNNK